MQIAAQLGVISKEEIQQHVPHPPSSWHQECQKVTSGMRDISLGRCKVTTLESTGHQQALSANYGVSLSVLVDLAKRVTPGSSIADVITTIIKPETTVNQNSRFLDVLPGKLTGSAKHYIIFSPNNSIHSLVNALQLHFNLSRKDTTSSSYYSNSTSSTKQVNSECCLWMDMISGNQHRPVRHQDLKQMAAVIQGADQVLLALDQHAYVLSQAVTFYELMQSFHCHDNLRQKWKLTVLPLSWVWSDMRHAFCTMSLEKSEVGPRFDKDQISALIQEQIEAGVDGTPAALQIKAALLSSTKADIARMERQAHHNLWMKRVEASSHYAMLLYLSGNYSEAEEVLLTSKAVSEKAKLVPETTFTAGDNDCESVHLMFLAMIYREKMQLQEEYRVLAELSLHFETSSSALRLRAAAMLVEVMVKMRLFTKAELMSRKLLSRNMDMYGRQAAEVAQSMLLLASISVVQSLYDEASADWVERALSLMKELKGLEDLLTANCYQILSRCREERDSERSAVLLDQALRIRVSELGEDHPETLSLCIRQAKQFMAKEDFSRAVTILTKAYDVSSGIYGMDSVYSLQALGLLADVHHSLGNSLEAVAAEKNLLSLGKAVLRRTRIDNFQSLHCINAYFAERGHLLQEAASYLAKSYVTFKEKLGSDAELTLVACEKNMETLIRRGKAQGQLALERGQLHDLLEELELAEQLYRQAWSFAKLVHPEGSHKVMAQGLSDALFGLGKSQEAMTVLKSAGLVKKDMSENMPTSYLRWLNKRVAKYIDKAGGTDSATAAATAAAATSSARRCK
ncbi:hypothetical protein CEUSTIGMA_g13381.t1 [Chlamydomonas eustigma]|uniref:MalT-like TPR region domain-containing protein n=1 Tax=Chlamydomonas eustigma TaxID=1157962 RepID=A0A250XSD7_9CHLO|nr:hypothetical protein CEUSTIGMA_g13381.t1 [Chlamydomonas eustigma]|eukprot:GAX85965.1 hypothetical protein CEUSTIGMA_g13381.t1 [Chlamydomonas eustigma]